MIRDPEHVRRVTLSLQAERLVTQYSFATAIAIGRALYAEHELAFFKMAARGREQWLQRADNATRLALGARPR